MSAGETAALLSGANSPTATTEGPTPGMDIKGDSFIGSPVATASTSPPPVSRPGHHFGRILQGLENVPCR